MPFLQLNSLASGILVDLTMLKYAITIGIALMLSIHIAYGQVLESENGFDDELQPQQQLQPESSLSLSHFKVFVQNAIPTNDYRICAGSTGTVPSNFGCERSFKGSELLDTGYDWILTASPKNTILYGCVIGDTEKKISCNVSAMPQEGQTTELSIDWSQPSPMDLPSTFRQYDTTYPQLLTEMNQQRNNQENNNEVVGNNNNEEDD